MRFARLTPAGRRAMTAAILLLVTLAAFSPVTLNDFVNYDDPENLYENPMVNRGLSFEGLRWAFTLSEFPNWHPLTWLSHMADFQLFGSNASGHHLVSLLLHAAGAAALLLVLRAATGALLPSALAAAYYAVHPLRVESVAWASERKDVLTVLLGILTIGAYLRFVRRRTAATWVAALALYACALLAKPLLVTLPVLLLLLDFWPLGRWGVHGRIQTSTVSSLVLEKLPFFALAAAASVVTLLAQRGSGAVAQIVDYPLAQRVANAFLSVAVYLGKTAFPAKLAVFYPYFWEDVPWWQPALGVAVVIATTVAAVVLARRVPALLLGWSWYLVSLAPVIGIVQAGAQSMADRYTYVPHVGLFVGLVWAARAALVQRPELGRLVVVAAATSLAALAVATALQTTLWRSSETLFRHAITVTKRNYIAYSNLGNALALAGRGAEGSELIARAYRENPAFRGEALVRSGELFERQGRHREAADQYRKALKLAPHDARVAAKLRAAEALAGSAPPAASGAALDPHASLAPNLAALEAYDRGNSLVREGRREEAAVAYREAVRLAPNFEEAWVNLGVALGELGRLDEAESALAQAVLVAPGSKLGTSNLAAVRAMRSARQPGSPGRPSGR